MSGEAEGVRWIASTTEIIRGTGRCQRCRTTLSPLDGLPILSPSSHHINDSRTCLPLPLLPPPPLPRHLRKQFSTGELTPSHHRRKASRRHHWVWAQAHCFLRFPLFLPFLLLPGLSLLGIPLRYGRPSHDLHSSRWAIGRRTSFSRRSTSVSSLLSLSPPFSSLFGPIGSAFNVSSLYTVFLLAEGANFSPPYLRVNPHGSSRTI